MSLEDACQIGKRHLRAHISVVFRHDFHDSVQSGNLAIGKFRHQNLRGDHPDELACFCRFHRVLVEKRLLHVLHCFNAGHRVEQEAGWLRVKILYFVLLAPFDVLDHLGRVRIKTLVLCDEAVLEHPIAVDELGDVVANIVRANDHAALALADVVLFDVLDGSGHRRAG